MANAPLFHQVLMNLITNAFHSMEDSGGVLSVFLRPGKSHRKTMGHESLYDCLCLTVQDTEVLNIKEEDIEETPAFGTRLDTDYILGMAKMEGGG
jgi:signal transduction histidine kinase